MEKLGLCMICGKPAQFTCSICGKLVCGDHYYPKARMCSHCIPVTERRNGQRDHGRDRPGAMI